MSGKSFLGVDGGGSRTTAVVFDESGRLEAHVVGDSINFYSLGYERARSSMSEIIDGIERSCGVSSFDGAFIGMSALNAPATPEQLRDFAGGIVKAGALGMDSDLAIALEALRADGACAVVISGTGTMAVARDEHGAVRHAGGWGHLLGDEGSGFCIATQGLKAGIRAYEGSAPATALTDAIKTFYNVDELEDIIDLFYNPPKERKEVAAFAAQVRRLADAGDAVALDIVVSQARLLAQTAGTLLRGLPSGSPIGLWGGIFRYCSSFRDAFVEKIRDYGTFNPRLLAYPPEIGAVFAAYRLCGVSVGDSTLANIRRTYAEGAVRK